MRKFGLYRDEDPTGISGTGRVADGVEFTSGKCVLHWLTSVSSVGVYDTMAQVVKIHGHNGLTRVVWDEPAIKVFESLEEAFRWLEYLPKEWHAVVSMKAKLDRAREEREREQRIYNVQIMDKITGNFVRSEFGNDLLALLSEVAADVTNRFPQKFAPRG